MDLPTDTSAIALGKPSEVMPDAENLDLANMPAIFDFEGDGNRACRQETLRRN